MFVCSKGARTSNHEEYKATSPQIANYTPKNRYAEDSSFGYGYGEPPETTSPFPKPPNVRLGSFGGSVTRGAPPSNSLFDSNVPNSPLRSPHEGSTMTQGVRPSKFSDNIAPVDKNFDRWITVFGFPASHTSIILSYFDNLGQIQRVKHPENQGNWVHILYQTKMQAEKALGKNGKTIENGNIMIGVKKCTDESVLIDQLQPVPSKKPSREASDFTPTDPYVSYWTLHLILLLI